MIFDADLSKTSDGTWLDYDNSKFLVAHMSNAKFQRALSRLQHPHRKKMTDGTLDPEVNKAIVAQAMSEGVLLDWKNVMTKAGNEVPYSSANAHKLLLNDPDFRDWVSEVAGNMNHFREEEVKAMGEA